MNITAQLLERLLLANNMTREEFIRAYHLPPMVYVPHLPQPLRLAFAVVGALVFTLALSGNALVIFVVARRKALHTVANVFVCSLAVSDLMITVFCIPITLMQNFFSNWIAGVALCKLVPFIQVTAVTTSMLTMACIAVERFQGILHPLRSRSRYTTARAASMLCGVWLVGLCVAAPMFYAHTVQVTYDVLYDVSHTGCSEQWSHAEHRQAYTTTLLLVTFVLPLLTMTALYTRLAHELWVKTRVHDAVFNALQRSEINKITRSKKRAVKMMVIVVILFAVCWAPFHVVNMLVDYGNLEMSFDMEAITLAMVQLFGFSNSLWNPIVYAALNQNYKKQLAIALSCLMCRRPDRIGVSDPPGGVTAPPGAALRLQVEGMLAGGEPWPQESKTYAESKSGTTALSAMNTRGAKMHVSNRRGAADVGDVGGRREGEPSGGAVPAGPGGDGVRWARACICSAVPLQGASGAVGRTRHHLPVCRFRSLRRLCGGIGTGVEQHAMVALTITDPISPLGKWATWQTIS
uniref:Pyroglutamylated RF-amide peptide receptor-like n=1 Tax=Petromyzon marinus TaxID=7757 RepID=A0AAJ7STT8_PETMA|nr:pyroglutamylated RF-amide peptide receptor-like [Petromyzon marinus]